MEGSRGGSVLTRRRVLDVLGWGSGGGTWEENVLAVFWHGSRLWGGATAQSDVDIVVIVRAGARAGEDVEEEEGDGVWHRSRSRVDAIVLTETAFRLGLAENRFLEVCCALHPRAVWYQCAGFDRADGFSLDPQKLLQAVETLTQKDLVTQRNNLKSFP